MNKIKVLVAFGTRPEAIKMAPLVRALKLDARFETKVLVTAQHREMLDQVLEIFDITPDFDMDLMRPNQSLSTLASRILLGLDDILKDFIPNVALVHGDTLSACYIAQGAFLNKIDIAHIEAGLRTYNLYSPWPEEANRQLISRISNYHFAPTEENKNNLLREDICESKIHVVGNTVIDALMHISSQIDNEQKITQLNSSCNYKKNILVTSHRRENFGQSFENICAAIKEIAVNRTDVYITFPVHKNPYVQKIVYETLSGLSNVCLIEPLDYVQFIRQMKDSYLILTDSGGIQEEAPSLSKPVLVMRDTTERMEAVQAGTVKLVGSTKASIIGAVYSLLDDLESYEKMARTANPYGDGQTSMRIVELLAKNYLN